MPERLVLLSSTDMEIRQLPVKSSEPVKIMITRPMGNMAELMSLVPLSCKARGIICFPRRDFAEAKVTKYHVC